MAPISGLKSGQLLIIVVSSCRIWLSFPDADQELREGLQGSLPGAGVGAGEAGKTTHPREVGVPLHAKTDHGRHPRPAPLC